jgi:hypothetical protein
MSEDPKLFDAGDYNLFRYCHNDPIDMADPMGLANETVGITNPRQESQWKADITNAERISLWQKSMESSIGGEHAFYTLQRMQLVENARRSIADVARDDVSSVKYANTRNLLGKPVNHCNQAVADWAEESGRARPQVPYNGWNPFKRGTRDALANELGDPDVNIPYYSRPYPLSYARRNDIIAQQHGNYGHAGVVDVPGFTISVNTAHGGIVERNDWGFRSRGLNGDSPNDPSPVVRHYLGD